MTLSIDNYYAPGWRDTPHQCAACDWQGSVAAMELEPHREQSEYSCPACECLLLVVAHPNLAQVQAAADAGHAEAIEQLALLAAFHGRNG
jgi:hypothetical protein